MIGDMKKPNPAHIERVNRLVNHSPYFSLLSMKIVDIGVGYSRLVIDVDQKHLQPFGLVHGGVFASIIDAAAFWATYYDIDDEHDGLTTVDLKLNYLAPATSGKLVANGRRIKMGRTLGYAEAEVRSDTDRILAHGTSTVMIQHGKGLTDAPPLPPKFFD
jgi:uncharacterized protein (TIGR00369 family)